MFNIILIILALLVVFNWISNKTEQFDITHYNDNGAENSLDKGVVSTNRVGLLLDDDGFVYRIPKTFVDPTFKQQHATKDSSDFIDNFFEVDCHKYLPKNMWLMEYYQGQHHYRIVPDCYRRKASENLQVTYD